MPGRVKVSACMTFLLAILFYLFFQVTKHDAALSLVNAFAEDPYDAVGSFSSQLALLTALISLLRAFRPYQPEQVLDNQKLLFVRGANISILSVAVTLVADGVAMLRFPSVWIGKPAGSLLAAWIGGMALLTILAGWLIHRALPKSRPPVVYHSRIIAISVSLLSILCLAFYPESLRQSLPGELLTIFAGELLLFVPVLVLVIALSPYPETFFEDFIDDLLSVYRWLKAHVAPFVIVCYPFEKTLGWSFMRVVLRWFNPRRHAWNLIIVMGVVMGIALSQMEGGSPARLMIILIVTAVIIGGELSAVLLGYALLAKPMGLFRKTSQHFYGGAQKY